MQPNDVAMRKRMQIAKTNKAMFLWIAIASALVGVALVVSIFLVQRLVYNEKVISKKLETVSTLDSNLQAVDSLKTEIRKLDVNSALLSSRANENDQAIQVILDALPSEANSLALGASLQQRLLSGVDGVILQTLQVNPVTGVEILAEGEEAGQGDNEIIFSFTVEGSQQGLKQILDNLERSIRTIEILSLRISAQSGDIQEMTVQGRAFYESAKTLEFKEEAV